MTTIFISYRRKDSEATAYRIYDRLVQHYERSSVWIDIDSINLGSDFRLAIAKILDECDVMAAVVGREWAGPQQEGGGTRLDDPTDWVRLEIEAGLRRNIPLIPILVNDGNMPKADALPASIRDFAYRQGLIVRNGKEFHDNVDRLITAVDKITRDQPSARERAKSRVDEAPAPAAVAGEAGSVAAAEAKLAPEPMLPPTAAEAPDWNSRDRHLFGVGPKQILSLDGGGLRTIVSLAFLERLEAVIQQSNPAARLADRFDLIGGTSTGALVATLLARGLSAGEVKDTFAKIAPRVFKRSWLRMPFLQPNFSVKSWQEEIQGILGERTLDTNDLITGLGIAIKRADTNSSYILTNNPRAPYWDTPPDNKYFGNRRYRLVDLIRATTAAPMYFEPTELPVVAGETSGLFVDGGMSLNNNPSLRMLLMTVLDAFGLRWRTGPENLSVVSIGTGYHRRRMVRGSRGPLSGITTALYGLESLIGEAEQFVLMQMQLLGETPTPWWIDSEVGTVADQKPLGGPHFRFFRYNVRLEREWLRQELDMNLSDRELERVRALDDPNAIPLLYEVGQQAARAQIKAEHWA